ncbi:hypothetical protein CsatB_024012 [Cannabis sativa]
MTPSITTTSATFVPLVDDQRFRTSLPSSVGAHLSAGIGLLSLMVARAMGFGASMQKEKASEIFDSELLDERLIPSLQHAIWNVISGKSINNSIPSNYFGQVIESIIVVVFVSTPYLLSNSCIKNEC